MTHTSTYIIYSLILFFLVFSTHYLGRKKLKSERLYDPDRLNVLYLLILVVLSFFIGFRLEVGVDWVGYVADYYKMTSNRSYSYFEQSYEIGFYTLNWVSRLFNTGYQGVFFTMALLSWYFYFKSVPKYILPIFIFFLFADEYFFWGMNGVRQFTSMAIWVYSIKFVVERNFKVFITLIIFASMFHSSAILLIPFYFVPYTRLYNYTVWILVYLVSLLMLVRLDVSEYLGFIELVVLSVFDNIGAVDKYTWHVQVGSLVGIEQKLGLGFYFRLIINLLIIILSKQIIEANKEVLPYFVLFFIGVVTFNIFYEFSMIGRFNNYFIIFRSLVLAFLVYTLSTKKIGIIISAGIVILYLILFYFQIYGNSNLCCPYRLQF